MPLLTQLNALCEQSRRGELVTGDTNRWSRGSLRKGRVLLPGSPAGLLTVSCMSDGPSLTVPRSPLPGRETCQSLHLEDESAFPLNYRENCLHFLFHFCWSRPGFGREGLAQAGHYRMTPA